MTTPPKLPRDPFTPPFSVYSYLASDCYYFTVKDAAGKLIYDLDDLSSIQWLCDRLNAPTTATETTDWVSAMLTDIAELPDRTSPDDYPGMLLITPDELQAMITKHAPSSTAHSGDERAAAQSVADAVNAVFKLHGFVTASYIAAIITKHMLRAKHTSGPGGVSLTDADKFLIADMRAIIEDGDSHGRAATHPTTIHLRQGLEQLILLITRLQGSPS